VVAAVAGGAMAATVAVMGWSTGELGTDDHSTGTSSKHATGNQDRQAHRAGHTTIHAVPMAAARIYATGAYPAAGP